MKVDIIILSPIREEYQAVRRHLSQIKPYSGKEFLCEVGTFIGKNKQFKIALLQKGKGLVNIALATERAINCFQPDYIFLVGTAGGIKKVVIGDVVIGTKGYNYESGRALENKFRPTPRVRECDQTLIELAQITSQKEDWLKRIGANYPSTSIKVVAGPIASGEKVVETNKSIILSTIEQHYQDTIALEMEAYGFLEAAFKHKKVQALIIRSISDMLVDKSIANQGGSRELAATHAAAFAFEVIDNLPNKVKLYRLWFLGAFCLLFLLSGITVYHFFNPSIIQVTNIDKIATAPSDETLKVDSLIRVLNSEKNQPPKSISKPQQKTFTLNSPLKLNQIEQLEKDLQSKRVFFDESFKIEFSHSGQLINNQLNDHLFYYSGGHLTISINGNLCCCNKEKIFLIAATGFPGNSRAAEEKRILEIQQIVIDENFIQIAQTLKTCLE